MSQRLSDIWRAWINEALPKVALNDRAKWELTMTLLPGPPQGPGGIGFALLVGIPGPVLNGPWLMELATLPNPMAATKEQVVSVLDQMVRRLHANRSQALAEAQVAAAGNGEGPPPPRGRLILPGS